MEELTCFTAYDVRGQLGKELNEDVAYRIGRAYGHHLQPQEVVVGGDARETSEALKTAVARGLMDAGVNVIDIGLVGTEEIYFATSYLGVGGGIEVTASHNPIDYNGLKLVREESKPISGDTGLIDIKMLAETQPWKDVGFVAGEPGSCTRRSTLRPYIEHLLSYIDITALAPKKIVVNSGNGVAGHVIDAIEEVFALKNVPIEFVKVHHQPDPTFPNGIPNPLIEERRHATIEAMKSSKADFGIAWDGDFDRCFLFDETGAFIEGYYIVGLLAEAFLQKDEGAKIIYDPRLTWNTEEIVKDAGGTPIMCKTGHAFIKERMRAEDAVYGGEMSAHHYFRDFSYCDSGMIPWLLVLELLCKKKVNLSQMVAERIEAYPSSGEINSKLSDPKQAIERVLERFKDEAVETDYTDGIGLSFVEGTRGRWRFNLRSSNTEPVVRLNVESCANRQLMEEKTREVLEVLRGEG